MKQFFSSFLLFVLLASTLLSGCKKDEAATPATGSLSGTVSPVGSITQVTASGGGIFPATLNPTTGAFSLANLAPGQYTLSFTAANGYNAVPNRTISVVAGQNTAVGTVQAVSDGIVKGGTMSWTVNGQTYTATNVTGSVDRQNIKVFYINGESTSGAQVDAVSLAVATSFNGVGNYNLNTAYSNAIYQRITGGVTAFTYQCAGNGSVMGSGSLLVTQYDETTGMAAGTFGFVGTSGTSSATITNGTFSIKL